jgi:non-ribosomal peptide synthetase component F
MRSITNNPSQEAIRAKCVHPSGVFVEFKKGEIEQAIPERFEQIVAKHPDRIAVRTRRHTFTYDESNRDANRVAHAILDQSEMRRPD